MNIVRHDWKQMVLFEMLCSFFGLSVFMFLGRYMALRHWSWSSYTQFMLEILFIRDIISRSSPSLGWTWASNLRFLNLFANYKDAWFSRKLSSFLHSTLPMMSTAFLSIQELIFKSPKFYGLLSHVYVVISLVKHYNSLIFKLIK